MRVLHVIARMNVGGTATYLANLVKGLQNLGIINLLAIGEVPPGEKEDSVVDNLPIRRIGKLSRRISISSDLHAWKETQEIISEFKPDLIHSHTFKAGLLLRWKKSSIPKIHSFHGHHLHDPEFSKSELRILNSVERRLAERSDAMISIGSRVREELLKVGIGEPIKFISIPPGIESPELRDNQLIRLKLGIKIDEIVVMWLGRFTFVKRPDLVIELANRFCEVTFVMAGGGELLATTQEGAPDNVKFVGFQDKNDMWSVADIALCTSDSEGMPLSLIEAQMAGVPVVSTNVGSVSEVVLEGVTGFLTSRDPEDLGIALNRLIESAELRSIMGDAAMQYSRANFTIEKMVQSHIILYRNILDKVPL
jgi:glycosyltransferase involved in cell wall biosynthesis